MANIDFFLTYKNKKMLLLILASPKESNAIVLLDTTDMCYNL